MTSKKSKIIKPSLKKTITKGYSLTENDFNNIEIIRDKLLAEKIYLTDSAIIRASLGVAAKINKDFLIRIVTGMEKISLGRPKKS